MNNLEKRYHSDLNKLYLINIVCFLIWGLTLFLKKPVLIFTTLPLVLYNLFFIVKTYINISSKDSLEPKFKKKLKRKVLLRTVLPMFFITLYILFAIG